MSRRAKCKGRREENERMGERKFAREWAAECASKIAESVRGELSWQPKACATVAQASDESKRETRVEHMFKFCKRVERTRILV